MYMYSCFCYVYVCTCTMYVCWLTEIAHYFFTRCLQESLLDRQDFLQWLLDLLDKSKNADDLLLKFLIPLLLRVNFRHIQLTIWITLVNKHLLISP